LTIGSRVALWLSAGSVATGIDVTAHLWVFRERNCQGQSRDVKRPVPGWWISRSRGGCSWNAVVCRRCVLSASGVGRPRGGRVRLGAATRVQRRGGSMRRRSGRLRSLGGGSLRRVREGSELGWLRLAAFCAGVGGLVVSDCRVGRRSRVPRLGLSVVSPLVVSSSVSPVLGCQVGARLVAADGSAVARIAISGGC